MTYTSSYGSVGMHGGLMVTSSRFWRYVYMHMCVVFNDAPFLAVRSLWTTSKLILTMYCTYYEAECILLYVSGLIVDANLNRKRFDTPVANIEARTSSVPPNHLSPNRLTSLLPGRVDAS